MKVLKIVILTLLISFLLFIASVYITFKYILTPERIKNYVRSYIEKTVSEQFEKQKKEILDKISLSNLIGHSYIDNGFKTNDFDNEIENIEILEEMNGKMLSSKTANTEFLDQFSDVNMLASKMFNSANIKMESLKHKITEYFSNKKSLED